MQYLVWEDKYKDHWSTRTISYLKEKF